MRKGWHWLYRCPSGVFCVYCHIFMWVYTVANFEDVQLHHQLLRPASVLQLLGRHRHINLLSSQPCCRHLGESRRFGCNFPFTDAQKLTVLSVSHRAGWAGTLSMDTSWLVGTWPGGRWVCAAIKCQKFKACWVTFEVLSFFFFFLNQEFTHSFCMNSILGFLCQ